MNGPSDTIETAREVNFKCNLCGQNNIVPITQLEREIRSCATCNSTVRMRHLSWIVSRCLFNRDLTIPDFPLRKDILGTGMTDPSEVAVPLSERLGYHNSFYDGEPRLDITDIPTESIGRYDFLISSEVFEHIPTPVHRAFVNARRLLKKGGHFIFSVPFGEQNETIEHFPDMHRYEVRRNGEEGFLINWTASGVMQIRHSVAFHPGRGDTLEMRFFSVPDIIAHLKAAGFTDITLWQKSYLPFGIHRSEWCGAPFSARAT